MKTTDPGFENAVSRMVNAGVKAAGIHPAPHRPRKTWTHGHWSEARRRRFIRDTDAATLKALEQLMRPHEARIAMAEILTERASRESAEALAALAPTARKAQRSWFSTLGARPQEIDARAGFKTRAIATRDSRA